MHIPTFPSEDTPSNSKETVCPSELGPTSIRFFSSVTPSCWPAQLRRKSSTLFFRYVVFAISTLFTPRGNKSAGMNIPHIQGYLVSSTGPAITVLLKVTSSLAHRVPKRPLRSVGHVRFPPPLAPRWPNPQRSTNSWRTFP